MSDLRYGNIDKVERLKIGASLTIQSTRGTGVRDQDEVRVESHFETIEDLREGSEAVMNVVGDRLDELRSFQPDGDGGVTHD